MFSCFSPLLVPFFSCTWCAQAWQWPLFKVSTQVSSHFSPSHFLKHTPHFLSDYFFGLFGHFSVPLSVGLFGLIWRWVQILPSAHWPILLRLSRDLYFHPDGPPPPAAFMRQECKRICGNNTTKTYQEWKMLKLHLNFTFFANLLHVHFTLCTAQASPSLLGRKANVKEWTEEADLFKASCKPCRHCRGADLRPLCFRDISWTSQILQSSFVGGWVMERGLIVILKWNLKGGLRRFTSNQSASPEPSALDRRLTNFHKLKSGSNDFSIWALMQAKFTHCTTFTFIQVYTEPRDKFSSPLKSFRFGISTF